MTKNNCYLTSLSTLLLLIAASLIIHSASARAVDGEAYAIRGGTVVTVTGATIQKGVVVIRNGLIEAVGADLAIPGDVRVIDATGMMIYPGLFDSYTSYGIRPTPTPTPRAGGEDPMQAFIAQMTAPPSNIGLLPEVTVVDQLQINESTFDQQRAAGITTALTAPRTGVFQGQSALINLGAESVEKLILKAPFSLNIGFTTARGGYPGSLMGVFAFLRQSFLDAQHYREEWARYNKSPRGTQRPQVLKSLVALQPIINGEIPVIFNVSSVREIQRAIGLAEEFKLKYLISGATQSYQIADYLKSKNATVLLSLSFPQRPQGLEDPEREALRVLRERAEAPKAAAALHKAGVRFAFNSGTLIRSQDYIINAARTIEAGLPKEEALKAMTIYPAQIFGLSEQLGSIEKGKIANVVIATGDIFNKETKVRNIFIDGRLLDIKPPETQRPSGPLAAGGRRGERGTVIAPETAATAVGAWELTINSPDGQVASTLNMKQDGETLSGEITTPFGSVPISNGRISGNEVVFDYTITVQGQQMPITAKGKIDGNSISGLMETMGQSFQFRGTKRPNK